MLKFLEMIDIFSPYPYKQKKNKNVLEKTEMDTNICMKFVYAHLSREMFLYASVSKSCWSNIVPLSHQFGSNTILLCPFNRWYDFMENTLAVMDLWQHINP